MPGFTESEITLNFPDNNYFRLGDCDGYKDLQNNFAEMDVCWYDQENKVLYIIELKNWENNKLTEENDPNYTEEHIQKMKKGISDYRLKNLLKKSVDTTCIFMSILLGKVNGNKIQNCSPFTISNDTVIKLLSIINWTESDSTYISMINTQYRSKFNSYAKLFDIKAFLVLTKEKASELFEWVS
ncbi:hypothetical protein MM236_02860 [Belliella sp. DSM 107340]|uniref:Nuclease-related domain-containing protein n=1 Tax=Belliella calami TaxID=2923436 RepID=A0ABS9UJV6_9BACT|nr:hypothetical protein [Belliella calami]MCH7396906.1 hypothetical protein [Belliella calami]